MNVLFYVSHEGRKIEVPDATNYEVTPNGILFFKINSAIVLVIASGWWRMVGSQKMEIVKS